MTKYVFGFGDGRAEGAADMRTLLGGKGANLAEMSNLGLPVPPGFTITTEVCNRYQGGRDSYPPGLDGQVGAAVREIERQTGAGFGDAGNPLLFSVRSGARRVHAGNAGHSAQSRPDGRYGRGVGGAQWRRALRVGFLSPLHSDVRRRRARREPRFVRGHT